MASVELLTSEQLAEELGVCNMTLLRWRRDGGGPMYTRIGNRIRYHRADINAWLAARRFSTLAAETVAQRAA